MKTTYNDIEITYVEGTDNWHFELRGRSRVADSLAKAKEAIDKEPKEKRAQTFPRFKAHIHSYNAWKVVTVTSVAEDNYYGIGKSFWILDDDGKRSKERDNSLFPVNPHNDALIKQIREKEDEINALDKQKSKLYERLQKTTVPAEIEK